MSKKYDEVMGHVNLSSTVRKRILDNVSKEYETPRKVTMFPKKLVLGLVASFLLFSLVSTQWNNIANIFHRTSNVTITSPYMEVDDLDDLSSVLGFEVKHLTNIPYLVNSRSYFVIDGIIGEIIYRTDQGEIILRVSRQANDISGNYGSYSNEYSISINGHTVDLKGNDGRIYQADWTVDNTEYSLSVDESSTTMVISESDFLAMVEEIMK